MRRKGDREVVLELLPGLLVVVVTCCLGVVDGGAAAFGGGVVELVVDVVEVLVRPRPSALSPLYGARVVVAGARA